MRQTLLVAAITMALGCSPSKKSPDASVPSEASAGESGGSSGGNPPSCTMSGTWALTFMSCAGTDITTSWKARVSSSVVTLTSGADGGCHGILVNTGSNCQETVEYNASLSGQTETDIATGITFCNPSGCKFDPNDAPCAVGDGAGTSTQTTVISGNTMTTTRNDDLTICGAFGQPYATVWTKQ